MLKLVERVHQQGMLAYASWNADLFAEIAAGPATTLWLQLIDERAGEASYEHVHQLLHGYLTLIREAIASGYIGRRDTFLAHCLLERMPTELVSTSPDKRLEVLVETWNLCEGLASQPVWLDQFVLAERAGLDRVQQLEPFLISVLEPALGPPTPASWTGPYRVEVLDTRPLHNEFLPGELSVCAPRVVSVRDRRRSTCIAILLRHAGRCQLFGPIDELPDHPDGDIPVDTTPQMNSLRVGQSTVDLPCLGTPYRHVAVAAGFVILTAEDSQRLWIVDSQ